MDGGGFLTQGGYGCVYYPEVTCKGKDTKNTITGCYECAPKYYSNPKEAMEHHKIMDDVVHLLKVCEEKGFV